MATKILIIDQSESDRSLIKQILTEYHVLEAKDDEDALGVIEDNSDIEIILADGESADQNKPAWEKLTNRSLHRNRRLIALYRSDKSDFEINALRGGAVDVIKKSASMHTLKEKVDIHVEILHLQYELEKDLNDKNLIYNMIFQQAPIGIGIAFNPLPSTSAENPYFSINRAYEDITGRSKEELRQLGWASITHNNDLHENMEKYQKLKDGEINGYSMDKRFVKPDGTVVWVNMIVAPLNITGNENFRHISLVQDITNRKATEEKLIESERSKSVLLSHIPGMAYRCRFNEEWEMQYVSEGCMDLTGYRPENLINNRDLSFNDVIAPEYRNVLGKEWSDILAKKMPFNFEYEIMTAEGKRKWVLEMGQGIYQKDGRVESLEGIILDISERKEIEDNLRFHLKHDRWTGLYNQNYLETLLQDDMKITDTKKALIGVNLSYLHSLNMIYGFHYTQDLIKKVAEALKEHTDENILLFRMYDNQFAFYNRDYKNREELEKFCRKLSHILESALQLERINAGIGVVEIESHIRQSVNQLMKSVLIASEKAIESFDDFSYGFFDSKMEEAIIREDVIKRELVEISEGIRPERLFLHFQPILDLKTDEICGIEALARLNSDVYGMVTPLEFISIAEKTKLIIPLGEQIIDMALSFLSKVQSEVNRDMTISINISAIQLLKKDFASSLLSVIREKRISPKYITLEITETIFSINYEEMNRILGQLIDYDIHIAIDDFGTGYSTLSRERELNINTLKIDKSFIDKLMYLNAEDAITGDIISMAHRLGHNVVAEGVEHEKQRMYLEENKCDKIQGYLISKPLNESELMKRLLNHRMIQ